MEQKDSRIKYNLLSGLTYQIVLIVLSFLLPRLYLENFGSEVNGVLSTIKQIFTYMCLLEAGVGLATTQALYKPVAEKDYNKASSVLSATNTYYFKTGIIYFVLVILLAVLYSFVIPTNIDSPVIFTIIILNAIPSLFSYFLGAKYRILIEVDGRKYVITNSETILQLLSSVGKILVLMLTDSLVMIQLVYCVLALIQLGHLFIYAKRQYKWLDFKKAPDYEAISQKKSVLVHQLSGMVFNNTDIILLSLLCDFKIVSVYTIYNMFFSQMQSFITSIVSGFSFALGQMFHVDKDKFIEVYDVYETFYIMANAEYYLASGETEYLETEKKYFSFVYGIYQNPSSDPFKITPKSYSTTRSMKTLAEPMILFNVASVLRNADKENFAYYTEQMATLAAEIKNFYKPEFHATFENI